MLDLIRKNAQSWGVKIAFGIIILVFVFWGVGSYDQPGRGTVAVVNKKTISARDFDAALRRQVDLLRAANPDLSEEDLKAYNIRSQVLQMLVTRELMEQEAAKLGVSVSPAELYHAIVGIPAFHGADGKFDKAVYAQLLARQGQSEVQFEKALQQDLLQDKMRSYATMGASVAPGEAQRRFAFQMEQRRASYVLFALADYKAHVQPPEEELRAYYEANKPRFTDPALTALRYVEVTPQALAGRMVVTDEEVAAAFAKGPGRFHLRRIMLSLPEGADAKQEAAVRERLEGLAAEVRKGADFAALAARESQDPLAAEGGDLGWAPQNRLAPEVRNAVAALKNGEVSAPVRVPGGYALFWLEATSPDWSKPEAEIKKTLREDLAEEKALLAFRDLQTQIEDSVALGKPLNEIAAQLELEPRALPLTPREELSAALNLRRNAPAGIFDGKPGTLAPGVLEVRDGFVVVEITEQQAMSLRPFDAVRSEILESVLTREAALLASKAAQEAVKDFAAGLPDAYKDKVFVTAPFGRRGAIAGVGNAPALTGALFDAPLGKWLDRPYEVDAGAVIAMPTESIPMSAEDWKRMEPMANAELLEIKRNELYMTFMRNLVANAKVTVPDPSLLKEQE